MMPSQPRGSILSDDEEAPETLSLIDSRRDGEKHADAIKQIQAAEKEKKRARNRERDRRLKEQAQSSKRRRKAVEESGEELEARMKRAMEEAEAELNESDDEHQNHEDEDESQGSSASPDDQDSDDEDLSESGQEMEEALAETRSNDKANKAQLLETRSNPNHLPEHLFTSAFTSSTVKSTKSLSKRKADDEEDPKRRVKKRARKNNPPKDIVIGSKTIRTLVSDQHPSGAGTIPSAKIQKFIDRTLALKGGNSRSRGWERRAANIGNMRRNGPAANFVRNR